MTCSYAGAPQFELTITSDRVENVTLRRSGEIIVVRHPSNTRRLRCAGETPTVNNTDLISVEGIKYKPALTIDLSRGPFAPGASPEADGSSEIEIGGSFGRAFIAGTSGPDDFRLGAGGGVWGVNLNPREASADVDLTGDQKPLYVVDAGAGADTIKLSAAGSGLPRPLRAGAWVFGGRGQDLLRGGPGSSWLVGEGGADTLRGGRGRDRLDGWASDDRLIGGKGADHASGWQGRDRFRLGRGNDSVHARDGTREVIRCGPGVDSAFANPRDRLRSCRANPVPFAFPGITFSPEPLEPN